MNNHIRGFLFGDKKGGRKSRKSKRKIIISEKTRKETMQNQEIDIEDFLDPEMLKSIQEEIEKEQNQLPKQTSKVFQEESIFIFFT